MGHGIFSAFSREVLVLFCFFEGACSACGAGLFCFWYGFGWASALGRRAKLCFGSVWFAEAREGAVLRRGRQETGGG